MPTVKKILIAEDELLIAKVLRMQLESLNYSIEQVTDGKDVLEKVTKFMPDLIIMDVFLKNGSSGLEAAHILRSNNFHIPIIFTSGNAFESTIKETNGMQNTFVLTKPVELYQINEIILKL